MLKKRPTNYTLLGVGERATDGAGGVTVPFAVATASEARRRNFLMWVVSSPASMRSSSPARSCELERATLRSHPREDLCSAVCRAFGHEVDKLVLGEIGQTEHLLWTHTELLSNLFYVLPFGEQLLHDSFHGFEQMCATRAVVRYRAVHIFGCICVRDDDDRHFTAELRMQRLTPRNGPTVETINDGIIGADNNCLLYTSPSPRDCS